MPTLVYTSEAKIAVLSRLSTDVRVVCDQVGVTRSMEGRGVRVIDGEGDGFASDPVASVVAIPVGECHFDAGLEEVGEIFEPARKVVVADGLEGGGHG